MTTEEPTAENISETPEMENAPASTSEATDNLSSAEDVSTSIPAAEETAKDEKGKIRKIRAGTVVSAAMDKTAVVAVTSRVTHRKYGKIIKRTKKFHIHDEENTLKNGDQVRMIECRPLSKKKRWRLLEVVETAR